MFVFGLLCTCVNQLAVLLAFVTCDDDSYEYYRMYFPYVSDIVLTVVFTP